MINILHTLGIKKKDIYIFGSGRSGTTWLGELIMHAGFDFIFEPLNLEHMNKLGFDVPSDDDSQLYADKNSQVVLSDYLDLAVSGKVRNDWTVRYDTRHRKRKVVKFIRANLMLDWFLDQYDFIPLFVTRNPYSVIASQIETKWWDKEVDDLDKYINDDVLSNGLLKDYQEYLNSDFTKVEKHALKWAIEQYIPKTQGVWEKVHLVYYDDLVRDTEAVMKNLSHVCNFNLNRHIRNSYRKPSFSTVTHKDNFDNYDPLSNWKNVLSPKDKDLIDRVLEKFGLLSDFHL